MARPSVGRYQIIERAGAGGFATVCRAWDPTLEREVALKTLHAVYAGDATVRERFLREGRALARVRHANLVQVFDAGVADGQPYLAMEFVPGVSLAEQTRGRTAALGEIAPLLRQVAGALDSLHDAGLVHRDVKPQNIMVTADGRAVLLDLGIARDLGGGALTSPGTALGTPGYLAPEQVRPAQSDVITGLDIPAAEIGPWTDIYQLGATAYALLAGRPPFAGPLVESVQALLYRDPPSLAAIRPDLPAHAAAAVHRALSKRADARPRSASAFVRLLEQGAVALSLPTSPARRIALPDGLDPEIAAVVTQINLSLPALAAALRTLDVTLLHDVCTGAMLDRYAAAIDDLRHAGQYQVADLISVSLHDVRLPNADSAHVRTVEHWHSSVHDRHGHRLSGEEAVYEERYDLVRQGGRWLVRDIDMRPLPPGPR